ncbi:MAG: hypothetical protein WCV99_23850 [Sterolibacterium sp.]
MEEILFLIPVIFIYGVLICVPIFFAYVVFRIGQRIANKTGISIFLWIAPAIVLGIPTAWAFASYKAFYDLCVDVPPPSFESFPMSRPNGFFLDETGVGQYPYLRLSFIFNKLPFEFYEYGIGQFSSRRYSNGISQGISQATSQYALVFLSPKRVGYWWLPPIYLSEMVVIERNSNKILSKASDLVFGGGIIGTYLSLPKMNNDYKYLSCGFASREIGTWRPKSSSDPRFNQYLEADAKFISDALTPVTQQNGSATTK